MEQIVDTLDSLPFEKGRPSAIISETIKGKGVSFIMNHHMAHFNEERLKEALRELGEEV
jgi:transketolase